MGALCVDSVQSTGVTYSNVVKVVDAYRRYRPEAERRPNTDDVPELMAAFTDLDGPERWAGRIGTRDRTSTRGGALKA